MGAISGIPEGGIVIRWSKPEIGEGLRLYRPAREKWISPTGSVVNGASIPQLFWSVVGGPLEGKYRNASIVHDTECERMGESSDAVHRMFYEGCRCGGLTEQEAKAMYWAVFKFGPRWKEVTSFIAPGPIAAQKHSDPNDLPPGPVEIVTQVRIDDIPQPTAADLQRIKEYIKESNPSLDELEKFDPQAR